MSKYRLFILAVALGVHRSAVDMDMNVNSADKIGCKKIWVVCFFIFSVKIPAMAAAGENRYSQFFENLTAKTAHSLAKIFWPRTYRRELQEWQKIAFACETAVTFKAQAIQTAQRMQEVKKVHNLQISVKTQSDQKTLIATQNLQRNLLARFDLQYKRLQSYVAYEKSGFQTPWSRAAVVRVETFMAKVGRDVRSTIERENYEQCSRVLWDLLGETRKAKSL